MQEKNEQTQRNRKSTRYLVQVGNEQTGAMNGETIDNSQEQDMQNESTDSQNLRKGKR